LIFLIVTLTWKDNSSLQGVVKMTQLLIPHDGWVIVGDGRKAIFLRKEGDAKFPNLVVAKTIEAPENLATAEQGADKPGRAFSSADGRHGAVEQTDWHRLAEDHFARTVATAIDQLRMLESVGWLALVAPPHILSVWRKFLSEHSRAAIKAELPKELTRHSVYEIERL
jgi:protein required for attachment to host cells